MPIELPPELLPENNEGGAESSSQTSPRRMVTEFVFMIPTSNFDMSEENILNTLFNLQQPQGPPPASPEVIESLKSVSVTEELIAEQPSCSICYDEFMCENTATLLPCKHAFDNECIVTWLKLHNTCPVCRHTVKDQTSVEKPLNEASEIDPSLINNSENQIMTDVPPAENNEENKQPQPQHQHQDKNNSNTTQQEYTPETQIRTNPVI